MLYGQDFKGFVPSCSTLSRWVEGAPTTISFYLKTREANISTKEKTDSSSYIRKLL